MVTELLQELVQRGIKLAVANGQLVVNAPAGSLNGPLKEKLKENREALLCELSKVGAAEKAIEPIVPDPAQAHLPFPLSDLQLGFYMANDPYMEYHVRPHCYMETDHEALDIERYEVAWSKALKRHELGLHIINADLQLEKLPHIPAVEIEINDFRDLEESERETRLMAIRQRLERRELPLDSWPWFDLSISLWCEGDKQKSRIHYNHNSFFIDGYATTQLFAEIWGYYSDPQLTLPARTLSYRDAVLAIRELELTEQGQQAKQFWMARLKELPLPPDLPQVPGVERRSRSTLDRRAAVLAKCKWDAFKSHAHASKLTPSSAIIAAYAYVVSIWSNSEHFIFSQMVTRRFAELHPEIKTLLGNFASLYPLEIKLDRALPFNVNATRIQDQVMLDIKNLYYGGMRVLQELNRMKGGFGTAPSPFVVGSGLFIKEYRKSDYVLLETSQTLLDHQFFELSDGTYYYVWDLIERFFPAGLIDSMWRAFSCLLDRLCEEPGSWTEVVRGLVDEEELRARRRCNLTHRELPAMPLHQPLMARTLEGPESIAVSHGENRLTYRQLHQWSDQLADHLTQQGAGSGKLVAVAMPRCCEMVAAVVGILKTGAAYVPIDPDLPAKRREFLIRDTRAVAVLSLPQLIDRLEWPVDAKLLALDVRRMPDLNGLFYAGPIVLLDDLAYVIYTSGTTGQPKGVMIEHRAAMNTVQDINCRYSIDAADRIFGISAFNFDLSVYDIFGALAAGATVVYPEVESALSPGHWLAIIESQRITVWNSVPALMSLLAMAALEQGKTLPSLRLVMLSGDKIPTNLPALIHRVAPQATIVALGGATEAAIWSILHPLEKGAVYDSIVPYGYPMLNQRWHVRDALGEDAPTWVSGELVIAGAGLARGYYGDEEKTARSFIRDANSGERLYRTGDIGRYLPTGCIEIQGRLDQQVKIHGHRIEVGEIEAALLRHDAVEQAIVAVRELGSRRSRSLVAFVCLRVSRVLVAEQLQDHLRNELPAYMIPQHWVVLDDMPRTRNGKVDRSALIAIEVNSGTAEGGERAYAAPGNDLERGLVSIWQEVLQLQSIGVTDDFFDLGGQSFDAIRIFSQIKNHYGRQFTLGDIWQARTIRALVVRLRQAPSSDAGTSLVPMEVNRPGRPIFLVHPAGGSITSYLPLAKWLRRPVFGFQARWGSGDHPAPEGISALAALYVAQLLARQPAGPYTLGGWSSGGVVAFEMARQLEESGRAVERLLLLDAPAPCTHVALTSNNLIAWFVQDLALGLPTQRLLSEQLSGLSPEAVLAHAIELLQPHCAAELNHAQLLPIYLVFVDMVRMVSDYTGRPIRSDMTVIRASDNVVAEFAAHPSVADPDWGWSRFTRGRMTSLTARGNHYDFLSADRLPFWAHALL